jgi:hypothetical protein
LPGWASISSGATGCGWSSAYLESLVRQGEDGAGKIAQEYRQASAQQEQEYAETAAALAPAKRDGRAPV